jgi:hypothetical protein
VTEPAASEVTPNAAGLHIDGDDVTTGVGSAPSARVTVWCYDECHSICQFAASKDDDGYTSCKCECHRDAEKPAPLASGSTRMRRR